MNNSQNPRHLWLKRPAISCWLARNQFAYTVLIKLGSWFRTTTETCTKRYTTIQSPPLLQSLKEDALVQYGKAGKIILQLSTVSRSQNAIQLCIPTYRYVLHITSIPKEDWTSYSAPSIQHVCVCASVRACVCAYVIGLAVAIANPLYTSCNCHWLVWWGPISHSSHWYLLATTTHRSLNDGI